MRTKRWKFGVDAPQTMSEHYLDPIGSASMQYQEQYLYDLKEEHVKCNNKSIPQIFKYLYDNYGKITDTDLLENKENMNQDWDLETPIQTSSSR